MYHDQATIPMKLVGFGEAVNVSLGLPIVRTSVDHGTAYDRAGTWTADARGMRAAIALAARLASDPAHRASSPSRHLSVETRAALAGLLALPYGGGPGGRRAQSAARAYRAAGSLGCHGRQERRWRLARPERRGSAKHAAEVLGTLRGLAAKVGQMASYVDGLVPEAHAPGVRGVAQGAARAGAAVVARGDPRPRRGGARRAHRPRSSREWDDVPARERVHRSGAPRELDDGREVAVKVQHPGIVAARSRATSRTPLLESFVGVLGGRALRDSKTMLEVIRTRFREELDYVLEARASPASPRCTRATRPSASRLVESRSSERVLTTELARGATFDEACAAPEADAPAWARDDVALRLQGHPRRRDAQRRPPPGQLHLPRRGARHLPRLRLHPAHRPSAGRSSAAATAPRSPATKRRSGGGRRDMVDLEARSRSRTSRSATRASASQPLFDSPYRIDEALRGEARRRDAGDGACCAEGLPEQQFFTMPAEMLFVNRLQFGFYSVLARLDVEVDYAAVERSFLGIATAAPRAPTPAIREEERTPRTRSA